LGRGACPVSSLCALRACAEAGASRRGFVASAALGLGALGLGMPATSGATVMNPGQLEKFQTQVTFHLPIQYPPFFFHVHAFR
jgi:hypothetical protein